MAWHSRGRGFDSLRLHFTTPQTWHAATSSAASSSGLYLTCSWFRNGSLEARVDDLRLRAAIGRSLLAGEILQVDDVMLYRLRVNALTPPGALRGRGLLVLHEIPGPFVVLVSVVP